MHHYRRLKTLFSHIRRLLPLLLPLIILSEYNINAIDVHPQFSGKKIQKIEMQGLRNNEPSDIKDVLDDYDVVKGKLYSDANINDATKALVRETSISKIRVHALPDGKGVLIRFVFIERAIISEIIFQGTDEIYDTELREAILIKEDDVLSEAALKRSVQIIVDKYLEEGLYLVTVDYKVIHDEEANKAKIIIKIDEGENILVSKIEIEGTRQLDPDDLIDEMETEEDGWFSDGSFSESKYEVDREKIVMFMKKQGFRDAEIVSSIQDEIKYAWEDEQEQNTRVIHIKIKVKEGQEYYFNKYEIKVVEPYGKEPLFTNDAFFELFELTEQGEVFDDMKFQMDRQAISMLYAGKGHIFARVVPTEIPNEKEVEIDGQKFAKGTLITVRYEIREGPIAKVEEIIIKGNKKTLDKVIRRELLIKPGEIFDSFKIKRSRERIYNLGFFKEVNFDARPGSREPLMNLVISVVEQPTGTISLGGGYGTQTGFSIFTEVAENNLMGRGQRISGRFEYGPLRKMVQTGFRDPWIIDDIPLSFSASLYYQLRTYPVTPVSPGSTIEASYDKSVIGASIGFGYRFWIYYGAGISFGTRRSTVNEATSAAPDAVFQEIYLGPQYKNSITLRLYRDSRDNVFNTVEGLHSQLEYEIVGWGGDDHYTRLNPLNEAYYSPFHLPFLKSHPTVLLFWTSGSFTFRPLWKKKNQRPDNALVELEDKLYVGGVETVRGWDFADLNYRYLEKQFYWMDGGDHRILYGLEYRIPVEPTILWIVSFFDAGALWDAYDTSAHTVDIGPNMGVDTFTLDQFVYSWGFGIRVQIPVLPIRLYVAQRIIWRGINQETDDYYGFYGFKNLGDMNFVFGIGDIRF